MKAIIFRDVAYIVVAPDNEYILSNVKTFFKNLSNTYSILKLGKHVPVTKVRTVEFILWCDICNTPSRWLIEWIIDLLIDWQ